MTEKLYYLDSHCAEHGATVLACEKADGGFAVTLDRSALFPEGGGQPADHGTIDGVAVLDVQERGAGAGADAVHLCAGPLPVGKSVRVRLDWARRFDLMQQHTGEHLLSFAFYKLFSANNVGFHLAETYATIDFDKPLSRAEITEAERLANTFVWRDLPVTATFYDTEEAALAALPVRKHAAGLVPPIRIVSVEGADCCTCCAPHCAHTGEVGAIFVLDSAAYKGGTRITFYCGGRALNDARTEHDALDAIARRFSVSRDKAEAAVAKLSDDFAESRRREKLLAAALNAYEAAAFRAEADAVNAGHGGARAPIVRLVEQADAQRLRDLAVKVAGDDGFAALFARENGRLSYVLAKGASLPLDISDAAAAVNAAVNGKGGGRGQLAQGTAPDGAHLCDAIEQLSAYFTKRLKNA